MPVTFNDIADKAGVSYSTVSRVINDHQSVSPDAAEAVRHAMAELGYQPPPPERRRGPMRGTPRKDVTGTIALLFPDADDRAVRTPLSAALTHGIENYLYEQRMSLMVTHLRDQERLPVCLEKRQVDGLIIRGGDLNESMTNRLRSFPSVWLFQRTRRIDWADQVMPDNDAVAEIAHDYLLGRGVKSLIVFNPAVDHPSFQYRTGAFIRVAETAGSAPVTTESDAQRVIRLARANRPIGIFCPGNEDDIVTVCRQLIDAGLDPCRDVTLIGCANDVTLVRAIVPGLPNIDIQPEAIGRTAAERLLWRLDNPREPTQRLQIAPRLDITP